MLREPLRWLSLSACVGVLLVGCAGFGVETTDTQRPPAPIPDRVTSAALSVADILDQLRHLEESMPAQQAEILANAQREFELAPSLSHQLRYASMLALPGNGISDPKKAQRLLRELVAKPESLLPVERSLAIVELAQVDRELLVDAETQRLQASAERNDRERSASMNKRLQAEVDENTRLKKDLDEAQAKLDAVANIERSLSERRTTPEAKRP